MSEPDLDEWVRDHFRRGKRIQWQAFTNEVLSVYKDVVEPAKEHDFHDPLPMTCSSYVMTCFSWIDMLSTYWKSTQITNQTQRMTVFMCDYMDIPTDIGSVAVNTWRHPLAHEAGTRITEDATLLYMPYTNWMTAQHMTIRPRDGIKDEDYQGRKPTRYVSIGLFNLIEDIERGMTGYFTNLESNAGLQENFMVHYNEITEKTFD